MKTKNPVDLKQPSFAFVANYFEPVRRAMHTKREVVYEEAKARYEAEHGHQFPYSFPTFCRAYYEIG